MGDKFDIEDLIRLETDLGKLIPPGELIYQQKYSIIDSEILSVKNNTADLKLKVDLVGIKNLKHKSLEAYWKSIRPVFATEINPAFKAKSALEVLAGVVVYDRTLIETEDTLRDTKERSQVIKLLKKLIGYYAYKAKKQLDPVFIEKGPDAKLSTVESIRVFFSGQHAIDGLYQHTIRGKFGEDMQYEHEFKNVPVEFE